MNFATCSLYIYISVVTCMYMYFKKMALKYKELDHMIGVKQITKCQTCVNFMT